jgi:Rod binding domain-containing protein
MNITSEMTTLADPTNQMQKRSKLVDAAQQFEASMLQELLKPMQSSQNSWGGDEDSADSSLDTIRSFGTEAVAKAISQAGGFGIAKQVVAEIDRQHPQASQAQSSQTQTSQAKTLQAQTSQAQTLQRQDSQARDFPK